MKERRFTCHCLAFRWVGAQQVTPAGQVGEGVSLDQISVLLIHERLEGDEVESPIRRDEYVCRFPKECAERLHDFLVYGAGQHL
jgi:hypothetical protein